MQRRRALQVLGALAAVPVLPTLPGMARLSPSELLDLGQRVHASLGEHARGAAPRALTPAQYSAVVIAAEIVIPRTDTPGAADVRVADFIDAMLADWYSMSERDRFIVGLADLDARATAAHGRVFTDCQHEQRVALLTALDEEVSALRRKDARAANQHWFTMLKFLTVWGYYTSRAGITRELGVEPGTGRYDGDAPYRPRPQVKRAAR